MKENKNIITIFICISVFIALMIVVVILLPLISNDGLRVFLQTLFSTIATVFLANGAWEWIAKERFADSILKMVRISENIAKSGIDSVYIDFNDINWKNEFANTNSFTAAFVYAYSWRNHNDTAIRSFAKRKKHRQQMRIIVPDPQNCDVISDLDRRFRFAKGETKKRIEECIQYYYTLGATVYLFEGTLQSSYYLMDKTGIMSFFSHSKIKGTVPAIKASKNGNMYKYIQTDIESLISRSSKVIGCSTEIKDGESVVTIEREKNE